MVLVWGLLAVCIIPMLLNIVTHHIIHIALVYDVCAVCCIFSSSHCWKPGLVLHRAVHRVVFLLVPPAPRSLLLQWSRKQICLAARMIRLDRLPTSPSHPPHRKSLLLVLWPFCHQVEHLLYQDSNQVQSLNITKPQNLGVNLQCYLLMYCYNFNWIVNNHLWCKVVFCGNCHCKCLKSPLCGDYHLSPVCVKCDEWGVLAV